MVEMNYSEFGKYIGDESPYANPDKDVEFPPNFDAPGGPTRIIPDASFTDHLIWDFRHARPAAGGWKPEPPQADGLVRPLKMENYRIVKAMAIPYTYNRRLRTTFGGFDDPTPVAGDEKPLTGGLGSQAVVKTRAFILVGYSLTALPKDTPLPRADPGDPEAQGYARLGQFIKEQTPGTNDPRLMADLEKPEFLEIAESWLAAVSYAKAKIGLCDLESSSDMEMDLFQEQQCLSWDFPMKDTSGKQWLRNFQVTKAIRATYTTPLVDEDGLPIGGNILVGLSGSGDV